MKNVFNGLGVALITPFQTDGTIDYNSLGNIIEYQIKNGIDFFCVCGTTAETPCLTLDEKIEIKRFVVDTVNARVPILLGFGGNSTQAVVDDIQGFDFVGVDGILSVVPYYNKPTQEGIYKHFMAIADAVGDMPVVLYNVPGRTGVNMTAETTLRLANDANNIVAIKEASGNIEQIKTIIDNAPTDFEVLSGDDGLTYKLIEIGAKGVISVVANALPARFATMVHAKMNSDDMVATEIDQSLTDLYRLIFADGNPAGVKALMAQKELCKNVLRLPLVPASVQTTEMLKAFV